METHLPLQKRGGIFLQISVVAKRLDGSRCHLVQRYASAQATLCYMGTQRSPQRKGAQPHQFSAYAYCDKTVAHLRCAEHVVWHRTVLAVALQQEKRL